MTGKTARREQRPDALGKEPSASVVRLRRLKHCRRWRRRAWLRLENAERQRREHAGGSKKPSRYGAGQHRRIVVVTSADCVHMGLSRPIAAQAGGCILYSE